MARLYVSKMKGEIKILTQVSRFFFLKLNLEPFPSSERKMKSIYYQKKTVFYIDLPKVVHSIKS